MGRAADGMKDRPEVPLRDARRYATKAEALLREIKRRDGMTSSEISRAMFWHNRIEDGRDPEEYGATARGRGYWCVCLYGTGNNVKGLLRTFCEKGPDKKWRVVKSIAAPFFSLTPEDTASMKAYSLGGWQYVEQSVFDQHYSHFKKLGHLRRAPKPVPPGAFGVLWDARNRRLVVGWHSTRERY